MRFYGEFTAKSGLKISPMIDFMYVEFENAEKKMLPEDFEDGKGAVLSCDWEDSDWKYSPESGKGYFRCRGVMVNAHNADGKIDMFRKAKIDSIQVFCEENTNFVLTDLTVCDNGGRLHTMPKERREAREVVLVQNRA